MQIIRFILLIVGTILFLNGAIFIGLRRINLGTVLPAIIGLIFLIQAIFWKEIHNFLQLHKNLHMVWRGFWVAFTIWFISFIGFILILQKNISKNSYIPTVNAIIVLGSGFKNGKPSPILASRLDSSARLALSQPNALLILSGGIGFAKTQSEAEVMANYLQEKYNLPLSRMILEANSTSTELNLKNSQQILQQHNILLTQPIAIVSSDFHTLRAKAIAKKQGYQNIVVVGSPTPLKTRFNVWLREYFAFISGWILNEY